MTLTLKLGTVVVALPKAGAHPSQCFVCAGPSSDAGEAFVAGAVAGIRWVRGEKRPRLYVQHETKLRDYLVVMGCAKPDVLEALGVPYRVLDGTEGPLEAGELPAVAR